MVSHNLYKVHILQNSMDTHRCKAYNKNQKRCRSKISKDKYFCCEKHYPLNKELIENGCFMCSEKISGPADIYYFRCHHAFHKSCYDEWTKFSNYDNMICLICREDVYVKQFQKIKIRPHGVVNKNEYKKMDVILKILSI